MSDTSASTAVPNQGVHCLSLSSFCDHVSKYQCLRKAEIISTESFYQSAGPVNHRFLLLELRRERRKRVWLRLDRRRGEDVTLFAFLCASGVTKANDTVGSLIRLR